MPALKDLVGERFGKLVVLSRAECPENVHKRAYWLCQCDCGNQCVASAGLLTTGYKKSCGCLKREINKTRQYVHPKRISVRNKSGTLGVHFGKQRNRWKAQIDVNGKHYVLGTYKHKEDAVKARKDAEARFHVYSEDSGTEGGSE